MRKPIIATIALSAALVLSACGDSREEQLAKQVQQLQQQNQMQRQALENQQAYQSPVQPQMAPQAQPNNITVQQSAPTAQSHDSGMKDMLIGGAIGAMAGSMLSGGGRSSHSTETRVVEREVYRPAPRYDTYRNGMSANPSNLTRNAPVSPVIGSAVKPSVPSAPNFSAPNTPKPSAPVIPSYKVNAPAFTPSKPSGSYSSGMGSSYKSSSPSVSYKSTPSRSYSSSKR